MYKLTMFFTSWLTNLKNLSKRWRSRIYIRPASKPNFIIRKIKPETSSQNVNIRKQVLNVSFVHFLLKFYNIFSYFNKCNA